MSFDSDNFLRVKVSAKFMKVKFPCFPSYIESTCRGACCKVGTSVTISLLPEEVPLHESRSFYKDSSLQPNSRGMCHHHMSNGLCSVHGTSEKPFCCIIAPFHFNKSNTLILRNRYMMLKCRGHVDGIEAYKVFRPSLDLIFGKDEAERVCKYYDDGGEADFYARISVEGFNRLSYLRGVEQGGVAK